MNTVQKVALIGSVIDEYSLSATLAALELPKSTWSYHQRHKVGYEEKYAHLQPMLEQVARQHPEYGYQRTTTELRGTYQERVNHKAVQWLHQLWGLALLRTTRTPKPIGLCQVIVAADRRVNIVAQLADIAPLDVLHADFTELQYANGTQKAYLMPIVDHASQFAFGWPSARALTGRWRLLRGTVPRR